MTAAVLRSMDEYLHTSYRPDREYLDGAVMERNMGKWGHSRVQALLANWFIQHEREWRIQTATEWRTRVSGTRVLLPDVVLVREGAQPNVLEAPPVPTVEILAEGRAAGGCGDGDLHRDRGDLCGASMTWLYC